MPTLLLDNEITFLYSLLVTLLYLYKRKTCPRGKLTHVLINDEGNKFFSAAQTNIEQAPTTIFLQGLIREFGIALILTSVDYSSLHKILKSNTYTSVCFNVNGDEETVALARHLGLKEKGEEYFKKDLRKGQCLIRFGDQWRHTMLAEFPKLPIEKAVTLSELATAEQRLNRYAPTELPPKIQSQPNNAKQQPEKSAPPDTQPKSHPQSNNPTPTRNAPSATQPKTITVSQPPTALPQENNSPVAASVQVPERPPVKLTIHEERLLRVATEKLWVATKAYKEANLARQSGQNAKEKLVSLGLLSASSVLVKPGRGGNAVVLAATAKGFALLGRKRSKGLRGGGSAQHRYCIQELAAVIPGAQIEFLVGGTKSVDLFVRFEASKHQPFLLYMVDKGLIGGDLVAIEFECNSPVTTGLNNITKNHEAGIVHTLIAVLPKDLDKTRVGLAKRVPTKLRDEYTVVDVFTLPDGFKQ